MSIFSKFWTAVKGLFVKVEDDFVPEAIVITKDVEAALNSQVVDEVVDAISPKLDGIPAALLTAAKALVPKVLSQLLGLQGLESGATAASATAWAQSVIAAYSSLSVTQKSGIYANLVTELVILFNQAKASDKTWLDWANTAYTAEQAIAAAITAASQVTTPTATTAQ